jgi:hypothetical protein
MRRPFYRNEVSLLDPWSNWRQSVATVDCREIVRPACSPAMARSASAFPCGRGPRCSRRSEPPRWLHCRSSPHPRLPRLPRRWHRWRSRCRALSNAPASGPASEPASPRLPSLPGAHLRRCLRIRHQSAVVVGIDARFLFQEFRYTNASFLTAINVAAQAIVRIQLFGCWSICLSRTWLPSALFALTSFEGTTTIGCTSYC